MASDTLSQNSYFSRVVFYISIRHDGKILRLKVERVFLSEQIERFEITAKNKSLTLQSNRPLLKAKGLKTRKPNYKLLAGIIHNTYVLQAIIDSLHSYLKEIP